MLAIFYVVFSVVRALLIPASTLASSSAILWVSAATLLASTTLLSGWGDTHPTLLSLGTALTGAGHIKYFLKIFKQNISVQSILAAIISISHQ